MELNKKDQMLMEEKNQRMRMETALQVNFYFFVQIRGWKDPFYPKWLSGKQSKCEEYQRKLRIQV